MKLKKNNRKLFCKIVFILLNRWWWRWEKIVFILLNGWRRRWKWYRRTEATCSVHLKWKGKKTYKNTSFSEYHNSALVQIINARKVCKPPPPKKKHKNIKKKKSIPTITHLRFFPYAYVFRQTQALPWLLEGMCCHVNSMISGSFLPRCHTLFWLIVNITGCRGNATGCRRHPTGCWCWKQHAQWYEQTSKGFSAKKSGQVGRYFFSFFSIFCQCPLCHLLNHAFVVVAIGLKKKKRSLGSGRNNRINQVTRNKEFCGWELFPEFWNTFNNSC